MKQSLKAKLQIFVKILEPAIQGETITWWAVNFKETRDLDEFYTWAHNMVVLCFCSCEMTMKWIYNETGA